MNPAVAIFIRRYLEFVMSDICSYDEYHQRKGEESLEILMNYLDWVVLDDNEKHNRRS